MTDLWKSGKKYRLIYNINFSSRLIESHLYKIIAKNAHKTNFRPRENVNLGGLNCF